MSVRALLAAIILIILVGPAQAAKPTPPATPVISSGPARSNHRDERHVCFQQLNRWLNLSLLPGFRALRGLHESPELQRADRWQPRIPSSGEAQGASLATSLLGLDDSISPDRSSLRRSTPAVCQHPPRWPSRPMAGSSLREKAGALRVISGGTLLATPFLTVSVDTAGEQGLLGVAFDPNFATNRFIYIYYSSLATGQNRLSRFTASASNPNVAAAGSEFVLLDNITGTATNHQGGAIHFASDGKLYVAVGDDANSTDADELDTLRGKILRLNADGSIPATTPSWV